MPDKINWETLNPSSDLEYHKPTTFGTHKAKSVKVTARHEKPLYIQCPPCLLKYGCESKETPTPTNPHAKKYYAPLTFPTVCTDSDGNYMAGPDATEQLKFVKFLSQLDDTNLNVAYMNIKADNKDPDSRWFSKTYDKHVLQEFYSKTLRPSKDPSKWSPTFSTKLIYDNDKDTFTTKFYNKRREEIPFSHLKAGDTVIPIVKTNGLWFAGSSFGMSFQIVQLMVIKESNNSMFTEFAIDWKDPEEENDIEYNESKKRKLGD